MFPGRQQIYQELRKSASFPILGESSFLNFARTQDNRRDNTFVGPLGNLACCQAEHFVGMFLILVFLACLMQPGDNISSTFLLFVEKSGLNSSALS